MTIKILQTVGSDLKGAVIEVDQHRADRLIRTGYAVAVKPKKAKE